MLPERTTFPGTRQAALTPFLTHCSELFIGPKKLNSFAIKQTQTLSPKHRGGVVPSATAAHGVGHFQDANCASASPFRINTCKSVSKQRTLTTFRMNTYAKTGGRGSTEYLPPITAACCYSEGPRGRKYWVPFTGSCRRRRSCCRSALRSTKSISEVLITRRSEAA
jgi:hypothetical protein